MASIPFALHRESAVQLRASDRIPAAKRICDIAGSFAGLVFLAPLLVVIGILIWVLDPGPVVYAQERVGKNGRLFRCLKFRTMVVNADQVLARVLDSDLESRREWQKLHKLKNDPRVTKLGKFLRVSSIDELPQLLNVLLGDMSLVGPRPIVIEECYKYGRHFSDYCAVKPGLTGLWQVSGRNGTTYRRRIAMDVVYSRRVSFQLDMKILLMTLPVLVRGEGC